MELTPEKPSDPTKDVPAVDPGADVLPAAPEIAALPEEPKTDEVSVEAPVEEQIVPEELKPDAEIPPATKPVSDFDEVKIPDAEVKIPDTNEGSSIEYKTPAEANDNSESGTTPPQDFSVPGETPEKPEVEGEKKGILGSIMNTLGLGKKPEGDN